MFIKSCVTEYPNHCLNEVAIVGRSNAGKSSFINAISKTKEARVSKTPGKTDLLNFFNMGDYVIVDMPGYGYAKRSTSKINQWKYIVENYLVNRSSLKSLILLMDIRRDWSKDEMMLAKFAIKRSLSTYVVLNKSDKVRNKKDRVEQIKKDSGLNDVLFFSARTKEGLKDVKKNYEVSMKAIGVIPSRYSSTRFPGKPLEKILGKTLIGHVIENSKQASLSELIVTTDSKKIADEARKYNVKVVMTDSDLPSGTDRVWEVVKNLNCDVVINIQGDEPLIKSSEINRTIEPFNDPKIQMTTLAGELTKEDLYSTNTVKVVVNINDFALYFSRFPIPYSRNNNIKNASLKHIGIYAFRHKFLKKFCNEDLCVLEQMEGLEQLRALYLGGVIKVIRTNIKSHGVDIPDDIKIVENLL